MRNMLLAILVFVSIMYVCMHFDLSFLLFIPGDTSLHVLLSVFLGIILLDNIFGNPLEKNKKRRGGGAR